MNKDQLIAAFEVGDMGLVEFFELAIEAGMDLAEIETRLQEAEEDL